MDKQLEYNNNQSKQIIKIIEIIIKVIAWVIFLVYFLSFLGYFWRELRSSIYIPKEAVRLYNLQPFKTILAYLFNQEHLNQSIIFSNLIGNITALIPLGFLLPLLFKIRKYRWLVLVCSIIISLFELSQFITKTGSLDIDDLILNLLGCSIGFCLYVLLTKLYSKLLRKLE